MGRVVPHLCLSVSLSLCPHRLFMAWGLLWRRLVPPSAPFQNLCGIPACFMMALAICRHFARAC